MKSAFSLCLIVCFVLQSGSAQQAARGMENAEGNSGQNKQEIRRQCRNLLVRSYLLGKQFKAEEQAFLLTRLHTSAASIEPTLGYLWAEEAFQLAPLLSPGWNRLAHQKNSLVTIARTDPIRALELFSGLDLPPSTTDGSLLPEDLRAHAAVSIFGQYWKVSGEQGLGEIRVQAQKLGETGQYPFLAMVPIVKDLGSKGRPETGIIFAEATSYYRRDSRFRDTDAKFAKFIASVEKSIPSELRRVALQAMLDKIEKARTRGKDERTGFIAVAQAHDSSFITDQTTFPVLLAVLPLIREIDPDWEAQVKRRYPALDVAKDVRVETAVVGPSNGRGENRLRQQALELSRLAQLRELAPTDPKKAEDLARTFSDSDVQAIAYAVLAGTFFQSPHDAKKWLSESKKSIDSQPSSHWKVEALAEFSRAAYLGNDKRTAQESWNQALQLGEELFQEELDARPGTTAFVTRVYGALAKVVEVGLLMGPHATLDRIAHIQNEVLRANLEVDAATFLFESSDSAKN